jgi:hypothetical protein
MNYHIILDNYRFLSILDFGKDQIVITTNGTYPWSFDTDTLVTDKCVRQRCPLCKIAEVTKTLCFSICTVLSRGNQSILMLYKVNNLTTNKGNNVTKWLLYLVN